MTSINIDFCRGYLREIMKDVREYTTVKTRKASWTYNHGNDHWEFQITGPHDLDKDFYWHGGADNAYDARAKGWESLLRQLGIKGYKQED